MAEAGDGPPIHLNVPGGELLHGDELEAAAREALKLGSADVQEISMTFLADEEIRDLNRRYLGRDYVPDVLTFRLGGEGEPLVGDIYVGLAQAGRQAMEAGVSVQEELIRLVVHATLHLIGFDHPEEADARPDSEHYRLQEEIVARVAAGDSAAARNHTVGARRDER